MAHAFDIRKSSVVNDLELRLDRRDLFEWIEVEAEGLGMLGRTVEGAVEFSRELRRACKVKSVDPGAVVSRAELRSDGDGYFVTFNAKYSRVVRRFAIAHEFGHTILTRPEQGTEPPLNSTVGRGDRVVEAICDYFAAAMLIPRTALERMLDAWDPRYRDRPPVHLIPDIARHFDVQRRIAAWRLLVVSGLHDWILVRARIGNDGGPLFEDDLAPSTIWTSIWYVSGGVKRKPENVKGFTVPFSSRRRIPPDMIPDVAGETALVTLDSRWRDGTRPQPTDVGRRPMRLRHGNGGGVGYAARVSNSLYIGFRNTDEL